MTFTVEFPKTDKDVFTAKVDGRYVGCFQTDNSLTMTTEFYEKPLAAANAARKLKKEMSFAGSGKAVTTVIKKQKKTKTKTKKSVKLTGRLYTADEVTALPLLSFQEVWIVTRGEEYVRDCLNQEKKQLVSMTKDKEKAKRFKSHEDALRAARVLKGCVGPGFSITRYWINLN